MELIEKAILNNELNLFFLGFGDYHVKGITDNPEPIDYNYMWHNEIIPYLNSGNNRYIIDSLAKIFAEILQSSNDSNLKLYSIISHLNWYYFFKANNLIGCNIDFTSLVPVLKSKLEEQKFNLKKDFRWAGENWNSLDGLWSPLIRVAKAIRDKYNGIDFVPSEEV